MDFSYEQTTKIIFGKGKISRIGAVAKEYGTVALLVTVPEFPAVSALYQKVKAYLKEAGLRVVHFDGVVPNPTTESVDAGTELARQEQVDVVIGLGGGSSMDTAKAIAMAAVNPGRAWDYLFFKTPQPEKTLPCIAVTTTSGTGSQVTQVAVMTETETCTKSAVFNNLIYPRAALVDPELMLTVPEHITASTGFDAFCHCFESYLNVKSSLYTDIIALEGIRMTAKYLRRAVRDPGDIEAREGMAWADTCGGLAIANAGVTLPHGVGMTISGHCPQIMHGESLALTYPSFLRFTRPAAVEKFAAVGRILEPGLFGASDEEASYECCEAIDRMLKEIGMWISFRRFGVSTQTIRRIADRSHDLPDYQANPVIAEIDEIYRQLMDGYERT
ncbi:iron-containing alcohol dehydrogenase [Massiliimalia massiliensis]|uniref:iron-containing alcohol dehydrogenase n=1 Tax=Massiliimalia massiliensis TaxID=1852384 RepID=UPI000987953F|nr:iron-containing alcohol dehydrogenase [Massiliimalia massiliensis]